MRRVVTWVIAAQAGLAAAAVTPETAPTNSPAPEEITERLLVEQKHFADCLAYAYGPALWVSYEGALYFAPKDEAQAKAVESMKVQRARYVAFTNPVTRHEFAAKVLAQSGVPAEWQKKVFLPLSPTNRNLMPGLPKPITILRSYKVLQDLGGGDALLQDDEGTYFVTDYGRGAADSVRSNAFLLEEGTRTYRTVSGGSKTVEAFANVALNREEIAVLSQVVVAFRKESARLAGEIANFKQRADFLDHRARASDSEPGAQFLLARDYLEGNGTAKDEKLGLELMRKAAANGSGQAREYLEKVK